MSASQIRNQTKQQCQRSRIQGSTSKDKEPQNPQISKEAEDAGRPASNLAVCRNQFSKRFRILTTINLPEIQLTWKRADVKRPKNQSRKPKQETRIVRIYIVYFRKYAANPPITPKQMSRTTPDTFARQRPKDTRAQVCITYVYHPN